MTKLKLLTAMTILIALGGATTIKVFDLAPTSAAAQRVNTALARTDTPETRPYKSNIVAAGVMDRSPNFFVGTGDGSAGSWARP
jgi:hypothetical protein